MKQFLYVLTSKSGLIKIGISVDVALRRKQLQTGAGHEIAIHRTFGPLNNAARLERIIHRLLSGSCVGGEWFSIGAEKACSTIDDTISSFVDGVAADEIAGGDDLERLLSETLAGHFKEPLEAIEFARAVTEKYVNLADQYIALEKQFADSLELIDHYHGQAVKALAIGNDLAGRVSQLESELESLAQPKLFN